MAEGSGSIPRRIRRASSIDDIIAIARRRLPRMVFDFIDGGAETETSLRANLEAFQRYALTPRVLVDVSRRNLATNLFGHELSMPVVIGPVGMPALANPVGEPAAARAAHRAGTVLTVGTGSSFTLESIAQNRTGPLWFQLYAWGDRELTGRLISRARNAGYSLMMLTVDSAMYGHRERDIRNGFTLPPNLRIRSVMDTAIHPMWWTGLLRRSTFSYANLRGMPGVPVGSRFALMEYANKQLSYNPQLDWTEFRWMRDQWSGPLLVKGVMSPLDAERAVLEGANGVVVSNHGGRQLDGSLGTLDVLPAVVETVAGRVPVLIDGGIRRGADVIKAIALGASACLVARPYAFGLAAGGEAGVYCMLELLRSEMDRALALLGAPGIESLGPHFLAARAETLSGTKVAT